MNRAPIVLRTISTSLFFLWGFPNALTNPMVEVFKNVLSISNVNPICRTKVQDWERLMDQSDYRLPNRMRSEY